jgi:hypothetical protein
MSKQGYLAINVIPGSFDLFAFCDFIVEDVVHYYFIYYPPTHNQMCAAAENKPIS